MEAEEISKIRISTRMQLEAIQHRGILIILGSCAEAVLRNTCKASWSQLESVRSQLETVLI